MKKFESILQENTTLSLAHCDFSTANHEDFLKYHCYFQLAKIFRGSWKTRHLLTTVCIELFTTSVSL